MEDWKEGKRWQIIQKKTLGEIRIILGGMMKKQGKEKDVG